MKLYLHIGIEKTGTSFLQSMMAMNRSVLNLSSIYFPKAHIEFRDREMLEGKISPGNGQMLQKCLRDSDFNILEKYLIKIIEEASHNKCDAILLSNENIIRGFAKQQNVQQFNDLVNRLLIDQIFGLVVLRDPTSLALSMYKHRSKSGQTSEISEWIENDFDNINVMADFINTYNKYPIKWTFRKYEKNTQFMLNLLFSDWLGLKINNLTINESSVNPSLSLSELEVIRLLKKTKPELVQACYQKLLSIPDRDKAKDFELESQIGNIISLKLKKWSKTITSYNELLPQSEKLEISKISKINKEIEGYKFSQVQLEVILGLFKFTNLLYYKYKYLIHKLLMKLPYAVRLHIRDLRNRIKVIK